MIERRIWKEGNTYKYIWDNGFTTTIEIDDLLKWYNLIHRPSIEKEGIKISDDVMVMLKLLE